MRNKLHLDFVALALLASICLFAGCASRKFAGTFDGKIYTSAQGDYSVPIPVTYGGRVAGDDERGVTFRDDMGMRVSFYSMQIEPSSPMAAVLKSSKQQALEQYLQILYHGAEPLTFHPEVRDGATSLVFSKDGISKTSVGAFVQSNRIYLVEFDLPAATRSLWQGTQEDQVKWLENRAVELLEMDPKIKTSG